MWRSRAPLSALDVGQQESLLRSLLRRSPTWAFGHKTLSELALQSNNIPLAYSSAIIYERLAQRSPTDRRDALTLIGRCFLRRGDCDRALEHFLKARELAPETPQLSEEIAAAYILKGMHAEAYATLKTIDPASLSAEGKAALSFVEGKCG